MPFVDREGRIALVADGARRLVPDEVVAVLVLMGAVLADHVDRAGTARKLQCAGAVLDQGAAGLRDGARERQRRGGIHDAHRRRQAAWHIEAQGLLDRRRAARPFQQAAPHDERHVGRAEVVRGRRREHAVARPDIGLRDQTRSQDARGQNRSRDFFHTHLTSESNVHPKNQC